jgi:carbamoyl-phosphate synthase small subunit
MIPAKLVLQTGQVFEGKSPLWTKKINVGEIVFNTGMVGYTEVLTDPSYKGQIICFTYPIIGNYGVEDQSHWESDRIQAAGIIVSELSQFYARKQGKSSLESWCKKYHTPIITDIDTRSLTKTLRHYGVVSGAIVLGNEVPKSYPNTDELNLVTKVSINKPVESGNGKKKLVVVDCGMKANIRRYLHTKDITIRYVPYNYDYAEEIYDGILISNGPGNPAHCFKTAEILKRAIKNTPQKPVFGICLGAQIMGMSVSAEIYKLKFGHRAQNHPCLLEGTNKSYLTSQNHGFAINEKSIPGDWEVWFRNLNDGTVQGLKHKKHPYSAVQFHPEAGPGPLDTLWLFDRFFKQLLETT